VLGRCCLASDADLMELKFIDSGRLKAIEEDDDEDDDCDEL
jgi:hypothetical protein